MSSATLKLASVIVLAALLATPSRAMAGKQVPFKGDWAGQTVSATPTDDPNVVAVVTAGEGNATHLGNYSMVSPHFSHLDTGAVDGLQIFEAANGDTVTAEFTGQFTPTPDGLLAGVIDATIIGGTGRFKGATGSYTFYILFDFVTFESVAYFDGTISSPGKGK